MAARKKPRPFPSEDRVDYRPSVEHPLGIAATLPPDAAMEVTELSEIERIVECATPEQFQQALSVVLRKMMVRGLREIPPPRSIKELQAMYDMFRKAEGIEARDRGGGQPSGGFLPRVVGRRSLGSGDKAVADTTVEMPSEVVDTVLAVETVPDGEGGSMEVVCVGEEMMDAPIPEIDAADPLSGFEV